MYLLDHGKLGKWLVFRVKYKAQMEVSGPEICEESEQIVENRSPLDC